MPDKVYPHIEEYQNLKPKIDKALKENASLVEREKNYFTVYNKLKALLFRIRDKEFLERIVKANNQVLIQARNKILPYEEVISTLVEDIDNYDRENKKLIDKIIEKGRIESKELEVIFPYLNLLSDDNSAHDRIPLNLVHFFCENPTERSDLSSHERAIFFYLLIKIKRKTRYNFAYPILADKLVSLVISTEDMPLVARYNILLTAGDYYVSACQRIRAMNCFQNASEVAKEKGDLEASAYALQKYFRINKSLPEELRINPNIDAINEEYKDYANVVIQGINASVLNVDPIEFSEEFAEIFQEVMWKVEEEIDKEGDFHSAIQRWTIMEKYFEEMGISWKNPKLMNPRVMFD